MTQPLITRLSKLDAPDREVDAEIAEYLGIVPLDYERAIIHGETKNFFWHKTDSKAPYLTWELTSSVDAVLALAERELPGWKWGIHHHRGLIRAYVSETSPFRPMPVIADHGVPAIALCIALLRAKEASNGQ